MMTHDDPDAEYPDDMEGDDWLWWRWGGAYEGG